MSHNATDTTAADIEIKSAQVLSGLTDHV